MTVKVKVVKIAEDRTPQEVWKKLEGIYFNAKMTTNYVVVSRDALEEESPEVGAFLRERFYNSYIVFDLKEVEIIDERRPKSGRGL